METLDKKDLQILRTLQENARLTTKELAARVNLSSTPVFERLRRLENGGYIKKYIGCRKTESGFCRLLPRQAQQTEQGDCDRVHTDHTRYPRSN